MLSKVYYMSKYGLHFIKYTKHFLYNILDFKLLFKPFEKSVSSDTTDKDRVLDLLQAALSLYEGDEAVNVRPVQVTTVQNPMLQLTLLQRKSYPEQRCSPSAKRLLHIIFGRTTVTSHCIMLHVSSLTVG